MKRTIIALAIATGLGLGTIALQAQGPEGHRHRGQGGRGNPLEHLSKELNLTPEQKAKVAPIVEQARPQIQAIHQEAMQKAKTVIDNAAAQIRPMLTPEQQQKFDAIRKARADMMNARREMHEARGQ